MQDLHVHMHLKCVFLCSTWTHVYEQSICKFIGRERYWVMEVSGRKQKETDTEGTEH